ncbi:MAG TPA: methyltransferase domain-containing protein [Solirubrobacteraceae bacterium]|nr:methyltransferase domain-containing protein [Solirubrobacteraceae bacterium]
MTAEPAQSEQAARAERTYAAAADHYRRPALGFWDRWGTATVARLPLSAGDAVLDVCCGAGASALPAAEAVAPNGRVVGLDLAEPLLALARQRAADLGLSNASFRAGDATASGYQSSSFDAVVCVFGVFFAADMAAFVSEMWRLVRPGGTLAITTWGPDWCEPASSIFWESVREIEPKLCRAFNPWDEITTAPALADLLARGGISDATIEATSGEHHELERAEDFWDIVLGSGFRGTVDALSGEQREALREHVVGELRSRGVTELRNDVVFASVVKE